MAKSILDRMLDSIFDAEWTGQHGEKLTQRELKLVNLFGRKGLTLRNIYLPKDNGETTEIDLVYITQKGIFVFESKNYSGWIFGDEKSQFWTVTLPNKQKNRFYNPIKQNQSHIKWLGRYVGAPIPFYSIIVFSERCELKQVTLERGSVKVIKRDRVYAAVRSIWENDDDVLSEEAVRELYEKLKPLTEVGQAVKTAHIDSIKAAFRENESGSSESSRSKGRQETVQETAEDRLCPRCGKKLVLRTAKNGANTGKQFWGCAGYPGCKYTEELQVRRSGE